ncbi:SWIM zinc finger family protein [Corynebacterium crudilactis]|uniref:SWIM-type domain-containing protein n=1 Tax=Corynebacterium crudilactis TaxID=1652495 RepID=A0A172QWI2_9CORY|nr:SWIM zinc finger family protein [Corynebacterium crudilactis]ANE05011.1 hypothetical protein ccrud_12925 [Corynebacterium crudilactis]
MDARSFSGTTSLLDNQWDFALAPALTPDGIDPNPEFFRGIVVHPLILAEGLSTLGLLSTFRYDRPVPDFLAVGYDPILTANGDRLRIESFSACNGVLARLDLLAESFESGQIGHGTTNVDVTPLSQQALGRIRANDLVHLSVGRDQIRVASTTEHIEERKVEMPSRWIRGLGNASELQEPLELLVDVSASLARKFLASVPNPSAAEKSGFLSLSRGELRIGRRATPGSVAVSHIARLSTAKVFLADIQRLRIYGPALPDSGSAVVFEFLLPDARLSYTLTPHHLRGFSGEGALLESLSGAEVEDDADLISAVLAFEARVEIDHLARETALSTERVRNGLSVLQSNGRIGWDLYEQAFFHRELPMDSTRVEKDNPRLVAAQKLVDTHSIDAVKDHRGHFRVKSGKNVYLVILQENSALCSCPWYSRHSGNRGSCKHVLAVRIQTGHLSTNTP